MRPSVAMRLIGFCFFVVSLGGVMACERHVVVRDSTTSPEKRYVCGVAENAKPAPPCTPATEDLPGPDNGDDTALVAMPSQCKGRIHEVYIRNAHKKTPTVLVRCATDEKPATVLPDAGGP